MIVDVFSRKIVGYEVYDKECSTHAANLVERTMLIEQAYQLKKPLTLHSDNGAPMKSFTLKAKLEDLGIISSYSRPRVSNDNPFSESLFRTMKYCSFWPSRGFECIEIAREWVDYFVKWYNNEHRHSQIGFVTPNQRHQRLDEELMEKRRQVYINAKNKNPNRWSKDIRNWQTPKAVYLNPEKPQELVDKGA